MTRKRRSGITEPEAVLGTVIRALEEDDAALDGPDPLPLLRTYHDALVRLLAHGPLLCTEAHARERELTEAPRLGWADVLKLRAELLQVVRSAVRQATAGAASTPIDTRPGISFSVQLVDGRAVIRATGDTRSLVLHQFLMLLHEVGLTNVQKCSAPDCQRLFVKVYRREYCSVQCQKRIYTREKRRLDRERKAYLAHRRRQRRKKGAPRG